MNYKCAVLTRTTLSIALVSATNGFAQTSPEDVSKHLAAQELAFDKMIDCMDAAMKEQMKINLANPLPTSMAEAAALSCNKLEQELVRTMTSGLSPVMDQTVAKEKAIKIATDSVTSLKKTYSENTEKTLIEPKFADARAKILANIWTLCVREKAISWSKLKENADTVATGAIAACSDKHADWKKSLQFWARSQKIPLDTADRVSTNVEKNLVGTTVALVLTERAKSLPKP